MAVPIAAVETTLTFDLSQLTTPQDIAEFTIWGRNEDGVATSQADLDVYAQNAVDAWSANVNRPYWASNVALRSATCRTFNAAGHTTKESIAPPTAPWTGAATDPALPWETSLCISEYAYPPNTFVVDGKRKRGRFYLPPMTAGALAANNTGFIADANVHDILDHMKTFYQALSANPGPGSIITPCVFSRMDSALYTTVFLVTDAKLDSQRRRQNREDVGRISEAV
jgi:hypothetical protein